MQLPTTEELESLHDRLLITLQQSPEELTFRTRYGALKTLQYALGFISLAALERVVITPPPESVGARPNVVRMRKSTTP